MRRNSRWLMILSLLLTVPGMAAEQRLQFDFAGSILQAAEGRLAVPGAPALPMETRVVRLPFGSRVEELEILTLREEPLVLEEPLPILPGEPTVNQGKLYGAAEPLALLGADGWYPREWLRMELRGGLDPTTLQPATWAVIRAVPIRTRPGEAAARRLLSAEVRLRYEPPEIPRNQRSQSMMILAPESFRTTLEPFAQARTDSGLASSILTLEEIETLYTGRDQPERIKAAIHDWVYHAGTRYVLLAGDADQVPVRHTFRRMFDGDDDWMNIACDLYYADLFDAQGEFCDWDANGNDQFGQGPAGMTTNPDQVDYLPDVLLARIPASTTQELSAYLDKVLTYESSVTGSEDWVLRRVLAGADTFNLAEHGEASGVPEGEYISELMAALLPGGWPITRLYETETYPRDGELTAATLTDAVNSGCGLLNFSNHGSTHGWHWSDRFMDDDVAALTNGGRLPFVFGFACSTACFDEECPENPGYPDLEGGLMESWVLKANGGALGYLGSTRVAFGARAEMAAEKNMGYLDLAFMEATALGSQVAGVAWAQAQWRYLMDLGLQSATDVITLQECTLFGDPAVRIGGLPQAPRILLDRADPHDEMTGDGDGCMEPDESFSLYPYLANDGAAATNVTGTLIALDPGIIVHDGTLDYGDLARGQVLGPQIPPALEVHPDADPGQVALLQLEITWDEAPAPLVMEIPVPIGENPILELRRLRITDDDSDDGRFGPGESVSFVPVVTNLGCQDAAGLTLELTCDDPEVTGLQFRAQLPDLAAGATDSLGSPCTVSIDPLAPDGTEIAFQVEIQDGRTTWSWTETFTIVDRTMPLIDRPALNPVIPVEGQPLFFTARVRDPAGVDLVEATLRFPEGAQEWQSVMLDDGQHGDGAAGDGWFGCRLDLPTGVRFCVADVSAQDGQGFSGTQYQLCGVDCAPFRSHHPVLLVADAPLDRYVGLLGSALTDSGHDFDLWSWYRGCPSAEVLSRYQAVVWYSAHVLPHLDAREQEVVTSYLEGGGRLLYTEQDLGWELCDGGGPPACDWYEQTMHARYIEDDSALRTVVGVAGDPISQGVALSLDGGSGARNQGYPSHVEPIPPARSLLVYDGYTGEGDGAAAVYADHGTGRIAYLAFGLEGVADRSDRSDLVGRILTAFGVSPTSSAGPAPTSETPAWWISGEVLHEQLWSRTATFPPDGMIYLTGGIQPEDLAFPMIRRMDPTTGELVDTGHQVPDAVGGLYPMVLEDEAGAAIFLMNGFQADFTPSPRVYRYDPLTGSVERLAQDDHPSPVNVRGSATEGNIAYLWGGFDLAAGTAEAETWAFDPMAPAGQRWSRLPDLPTPRYLPFATALDGKIYSLGGLTIQEGIEYLVRDCEFLDPLHPELGWQSNLTLPTEPYLLGHAYGLPTGSNVPGAGSILVAGGFDPSRNGFNETYRYDCLTDSWSEDWPIDVPRFRSVGGMTRTGRGFDLWLIGGIDPFSGEFLENSERRSVGASPHEPWCGIWTERALYRGGQTMTLNLGIAEGDSPEPIDLYVVLETAGTYLFLSAESGYPTFTEEPAALAAGVTLPQRFEWFGPILAIPLPPELPELSATWYFASLKSGTSHLHGGLSMQPLTLSQ